MAAEAHESDERRRSGLMEAAQAGDRHAYETLLRECIPLIRSIARTRGVPADGLDDTVQNTLLTVHRARHTYDPRRPFTAWLRVIAERRAIDLLRRRWREQAHEVHAPIAYEQHPDTNTPPPDRPDPAAARQLAHAVSVLPTRQREAVDILVFRGQSLADAAAATRRSKNALKVNLHRALNALRVRFRKD